MNKKSDDHERRLATILAADIVAEPLFNNIHDDPRWLLFLERIGESPEQLAAIDLEVTLPE